MIDPDQTVWKTDEKFLAGLPGGSAVIDWFGQVPSFHDAVLQRIEVHDGSASMAIGAFRMTAEVDAKGYFALDRHAVVTFEFEGVTGISLVGDASAIIMELGIRRVTGGLSGWQTCAGPRSGDIEVRFDSVYGLEGAIYAREVKLAVSPN